MIGNGNSTKLWHDPWLSTSTPNAAIGPITLDAKDLVVADVLSRETWIWNREALEKQFPTLVEDILLLRPSTTGAEDSYSWLLDQTGKYTSKSGYLSQRLHTTARAANSTIPANFNWNKMIWKAPVLPKI